MKTTILAASIAMALAGPAMVNAATQPARPGPAMTRAQVQAKVQEKFAALDTNRDGAVTKAEFDAQRAKMQAGRDAKRVERRTEMFGKLDTDRNGQISQAEFAAEPKRKGDGKMGMRDHGRMGHHGMRGMGMGWGGRNGDGFFAAMDTNKDGKVTLAEASAKPLAMFDKADANKDGTVTPEEHRAAREAMRAEWRAKRG